MLQFSVIIPLYNATPYIHRCLNSIFDLGVPEDEFEILCINDCSTDNTIEVVTEIAAKHPSVRLINHLENKRQGGASNTAIRHAQGEFCIFMDQDDVLIKYDIISELAYMRSNSIELLLCHVLRDNNDGTFGEWNYEQEQSPIMRGPQLFENLYINHICFGVVWMGIYKTTLLKRVEPFVENVIYEDTDWCYRCAYEAKYVQYVPIDIYCYSNNPNSSTKNIPYNYLVWRIQQNIRIWQWAHSVKDCRNAVIETATNYCSWNLNGVGILWKYNFIDRYLFYKSFSKAEYLIFKQWPTDSWRINLLLYPISSQCLLFFISPILRLIRLIKHL